MSSGASGCCPPARARAWIRCCSCWWCIGCSRRAANGGCIGTGLSAARSADLLGADAALADIHTLYACHDRLLEHKQAVFDHLVDRWRDLFNATFDVLLYDLTSTYFESDPPVADERQAPPRLLARSSPRLRAGGHRAGGDPGGFAARLRGAGGQHARTRPRLRDFLARIERQYGKARRVWVMDRGIPTEEVLAEMRASDPPVHYLVGTPKGRLTPVGEGAAGEALARGARRACR